MSYTRRSYIDITEPATKKKWNEHYFKWFACRECSLGCTAAANHVLCRGDIPASLLFIGEAPGVSENAIGFPFVGPSGRLLEALISKTFSALEEKGITKGITYAMTNILACYPGPEGVQTSQARRCRDRLVEIIKLVDPAYVVLLGKIAIQYAPDTAYTGRSVLGLKHPSYILRQGDRSTAYKMFWTKLAEFLEKELRL